MKRIIYHILALMLICTATACQDDFDELEDTNQRHIVFTFNTDSLFAEILYAEGENFYLKALDKLPSDYRLRITAYCYDSKDALYYTETIISHEKKCMQQMKIRHLKKNVTYRFVFVADVVKYDPYVDYYETWFQLNTDYWSDFYIYSDQRNEDAEKNIMGTATMQLKPNNQSCCVAFYPITYNGFCVFDNLENVDRLSGHVLYNFSFWLRTLNWWWRSSLAYEFDYRNPQGNIVKPISLSHSDSIIPVMLRSMTIDGVDSLQIDIPNSGRRPFVATFNCETMELDTCLFY